ncbi:helix-turn-helix transcriptional regulator [Streptomyces sp. LP11]|uniref:Helix-turn-helix transcriptional regulator n=1 Tax=Streptomyces pyxinicus TaxID=2970331 RepID=A0ABT2BBS6_9ACTN|nr:helix-turn-helix transcriptional regulator [Streptomyces sp. LP11]MCS0605947.1 helix-turn-helix transcriptional regulator [Streptomyces sp. LP11]
MSEKVREEKEAPDSGIPLVFRRVLKRLRIQAGMDRAELGRRTGYSAATITSYEVGRRIPNAKFIREADGALDAGGVLIDFIDDMEKAQYPAFFRDAAALEKKALGLHVFATKAIPGLLQTEDYAFAVFRMWRPLLDEETVHKSVAARLARQDIFAQALFPTISFVIEEHLLHRPLGGQAVMRGQLEQILLHGHRRNVEIQVMPTARQVHACLDGPFTLIETKGGRRIAYVEAHKHSRLHTDREMVRELEEQYGILRAQALTPHDSLALVEKLLGAT